MKKLISVILACLLAFSLTLPAFAQDLPDLNATRTNVPVVIIQGDGAPIEDKDGNELSRFGSMIGNRGGTTDSDGSSKEKITEAVVNILKPFLIDGILTNNWEPYYENLQKELSEMFGDIMLDENGEVSNGSHLCNKRIQANISSLNYNRLSSGSAAWYEHYTFEYDWRLDPLVNAELFHEFIEGVKKITNSTEVVIIGRCIGSNVVCAYLQKYGYEGIRGVGLDGITCNGAEPLSESMSGKFKIDSEAISRMLSDFESFGLISFDTFVEASINLAIKSGVIDNVSAAFRNTIYKKIVKGATSAIVLSAITYPSFWATVKVEDFDEALEYVFGEEGSAKRTQCAGLIEKITNYNEVVKKHIPELLSGMEENGNLAIISKYGTQIIPICESRDEIGDSFATVTTTSFGATTSKLYETLPESYIAEREAAGYGKYISPDKQIDASTGLFPECTWYVKGVRHSTWTNFETSLLVKVASAEEKLTVDDVGFTQFVVPTSDPEWMQPMTEENCEVQSWDRDEVKEEKTSIIAKIRAFLKAFVAWCKEVRLKISEKVNSDKA